MAERDLTRTGVEVDFFGEPTRMPAGPAKLAIETGAALLPTHCWFEGDGWGFKMHPPLDCTSGDVSAITQALADQFARNIAAHPDRLAHAAAAVAGRSVGGPAGPAEGGLMRIGMVCPYSFDVPGGVQSHVLQLAEVMRARGHEVSVLAPVSPHASLPDYVVSAGKAVPIPYNGSVARLRFGPATHRKVKKWLAEGDFDVLHLHEPNAPSLSMLALNIAEGPIVATFHTSTTKSLTLSVFQGILRPMHEKIVGRIAVSDLARRWQMESLGSDAVEIPNGVDVDSFASAPRLDGYPRPGKTVLFLGRYDESAQGHGGPARRAAQGGGALSGRAAADRRPRRRGRIAQPGRRIGRAHALSRPGRRRRKGVGDAQRRRLLRAQHRR